MKGQRKEVSSEVFYTARNIKRLSVFSDSVRFGDVVMQPPSLTAKPRKAVQTNKVCSCMLGSIFRRKV